MCPVCNREFEWRKKWEDDWENVTYCGERCRRNTDPSDRVHAPSGSGEDRAFLRAKRSSVTPSRIGRDRDDVPWAKEAD